MCDTCFQENCLCVVDLAPETVKYCEKHSVLGDDGCEDQTDKNLGELTYDE